MPPDDPAGFLRATPPFRDLPQQLFERASASIEVSAFPAGSVLVRAGGEPLGHLYVIRSGSVRLERAGQTLQVLEEGEIFGYTSLISGKATLDVVVEEDLLAYRLPGSEFSTLLSHAPFAGHFAVGLSERLKASLDQAPVTAWQPELSRQVQQLVTRPAVWVGSDATAGDAARVMRREGISSVLVRTEPPGIVTDRDFRNRVLAEDLGPATPVTGVFSRPLRTVRTTTPIHEAWKVLLDTGVHHHPVARGDEIVGVLTSTDLIKFTPHGPLTGVQRVERLASRAELPGYAARATDMISALLAGGLDAVLIAGFVAHLNDALVQRILRWAESDLGRPPAPYAWIVFGSEGRKEQTLLTDQDNALVYADAGASRREWFQRLADRINTDLEAAGFPACTGGYMARNWHGTVSDWKERFAGWIDVPKPEALLVASIFFDFRQVHGELDLSPLESVVGSAAGRAAFLRELARDALRFRPPPMLLLRLRGSSSTVDLKFHGISPIVSLARCFGLQAASQARGTLERLDAALRAGLVDDGAHAMVSETYRFLLALRLRLQLKATSAGKPATNKVSLSELTAIERTRLKDAFRAIKSWQEMAAHHYHLES